ncbi:hypothetical protein JCM16161A_02550 [Vulcanisaeta sp. JCM 16161]|uniref:hypothetical protein n=1 Tax=Vulcanisaeta sp. JCM 16161 TaxID=1295372 RepID=UPI0006CF4BD8|nr:hypothetical protein [Vulcanisaeta sp. JCM 16161]
MASILPPVAVGFFGLGIGYLIYGGMGLFYPKSTDEPTNKTLAIWGLWMPGFMQFLTGIYILITISISVYRELPSVFYMAGVAFTAYGVHWFALGWKRYIGSSNLPDAFMALGFLVLSILGAFVFGYVHDYPVMVLFIILILVYATEAPARFLNSPTLSRLVSLWQFIGGWWLMYLTIAAVVDLALGLSLPV